MLVSAKEMLDKAKAGHYAVGQFNINNLEWTKCILQTAQELNSPVILGVSEGAGKYMTGFKTVTEMVKAMDAGQMFAKKVVKIDKEDNSTSLFKKMGEAAKELILESLPLYIEGKLKGEEQDENLVSICPTIKPEQERLSLDFRFKYLKFLIIE